VIEMKNEPLSVHIRNKRWLRRFWDSIRLVSVGSFASQASFAEAYGMNPHLILELNRINGKLVLMGRNQTMKMLILAPHAEPRNTSLDVCPRSAKPEGVQLS
jgi:hypothetical protein